MAAKVILVEPDEEQREEFISAVRDSRFEVARVVETNAEAVDVYEEIRPHVIVMRLVSGKMGATAALDRLRKEHPDARCVASYNVRSTHLLMAAYSHGALAAIKQPFRLHRVVQRLTFAIAAERHEKLGGPIVRLEHPVEVRYKSKSLFSRARTGFCERLGLTDMDLNIDRQLKPKTERQLDLLLPPPGRPLHVTGVVEDVEEVRRDMFCHYFALKNISSEQRKAIEEFLVKAAKRV
ncbi:MAG: hypothetical protein ACOC8E_01175 [Planctomycetota bacterium]